MRISIRKVWCTIALALATAGSADTASAQWWIEDDKVRPQTPPGDRFICRDGTIVSSTTPCPIITFDLFGTFFNDANGDGVRNTGESGLASWNVSFLGIMASGDVIQQQSAVSSPSGEFFFQFRDGGNTNWYVEVAIPTGWEPTGTPFPGTSNVFQIEPGPLPGGTSIRLDREYGFRSVTTGSETPPPVAVSEPTALALLGIGGMLMGVTRRRCQRRTAVA